MKVGLGCPDPGIPLWGPSGSSAHLRGLLHAFERRGDEVTALVARFQDHRSPHYEATPAALQEFPPRQWNWLPRRWRDHGRIWDARRIHRGLRRFDLRWVRHTALSSGDTEILEVNAPCVQEWANSGHIHHLAPALALEKQALHRADRVIAVSAYLAQWAADCGVPPDRIRHVPNGVNPQPLFSHEEARKDHDWPGLVLGFVGSLKSWHGLQHLALWLDHLPEALLVIAGDGPHPPPAHPRIRRLGTISSIDLPRVVAGFDVALAPYPLDAPPWFCPLKLLDYRAQGVPVVATAHPEIVSIVRENGVLLNSERAEDWADAVRTASHLPRVRSLRTWDQVITEALR